jgi:hypothetical protein
MKILFNLMELEPVLTQPHQLDLVLEQYLSELQTMIQNICYFLLNKFSRFHQSLLRFNLSRHVVSHYITIQFF